MAIAPPPRRPSASRAAEVVGFHTGNEMAALSAKQIDFHLMGYYPITPSTEIAELLDEMKAAGQHEIVMVPADGEHSAAGICFGAAAGGGRVFNATSAQGCCTRSRNCLCSRVRGTRCCSTWRRAR